MGEDPRTSVVRLDGRAPPAAWPLRRRRVALPDEHRRAAANQHLRLRAAPGAARDRPCAAPGIHDKHVRMKRVEAIIRPSKLDEVKEALAEAGITGMTLLEVKGFGRTGGRKEVYRGSAYVVDFVPKVKIEIVCPDAAVAGVIAAIENSARTRRSGTGRSSSTTSPKRSASGPASAASPRSEDSSGASRRCARIALFGRARGVQCSSGGHVLASSARDSPPAR